MNISNSLKSLLAAAAAAATYLVTQTNMSGTAKDCVYAGIVFVAALLPGIPLPTAPATKATATDYTTPPAPGA